MTKISKILKDARELISDRSRWVKHTGYHTNADGTRAFCMLGAIGEVCNYNDKFDDGRLEAKLALARVTARHDWLDVSLTDVAAFNDHPRTRHQDVLLAFDAAIGIALAEGK